MGGWPRAAPEKAHCAPFSFEKPGGASSVPAQCQRAWPSVPRPGREPGPHGAQKPSGLMRRLGGGCSSPARKQWLLDAVALEPGQYRAEFQQEAETGRRAGRAGWPPPCPPSGPRCCVSITGRPTPPPSLMVTSLSTSWPRSPRTSGRSGSSSCSTCAQGGLAGGPGWGSSEPRSSGRWPHLLGPLEDCKPRPLCRDAGG